MAKKKNLYNKQSVDDLKHEIDAIIDYLQTIVPENTQDDLDWKVGPKGPYPTIVATIEDTFKAALVTIKECCKMLLVISEVEDDSSYIEENTVRLKEKLLSFQLYYKSRPPSIIVHRRIYREQKTAPTKANPSGSVETKEFLVSTQQRQIMDRATIMNRVLECNPLLADLEQAAEELSVKGDYEIPESLLIRGIK